ncbi:response regulator [Aquipuribacter sp. MA13-6]|uniref:response regulator n=1 Tax=unclassified Aquipuribacter TaxID=2635084 RepID=UPI003EF04673
MSTVAQEVTTVLVVDDHSTFAELLGGALDREPDLRCVGHATSAAQALEMAVSLRPDLVVMDVRLPDVDGFIATERVLEAVPTTTVVILTAHASTELVHRAASSGASGFLPKDGALSVVLDTLRSARRGSIIVPPSLLTTDRTAGHASVSHRPSAVELTPRELEVLHHMAQGHDVVTTSRRLGIAESTCRGHVKTILVKLDAHTQLEAVVKAVRRGIVSLVED